MNDTIRIHISTLSQIQAAFQLTQLRKEIDKGLLCPLEYAEEAECLRLRAIGNSPRHARSPERRKEEAEQDNRAAQVELERTKRKLKDL